MNLRRWSLAAVVLVLALGAAWYARRPIPVATVAVSRSPLVQTLVFSGRVAALVRVELGSTLTGRIIEVRVREGDTARAGDTLARLESAETEAQLAQARAAMRTAQARLKGQKQLAAPNSRASLEQAQANIEAARREARRSRELFDRGYVSTARIDDADRAVRVAQAQLDSAQAGALANTSAGTETAQASMRVQEAAAAVELAEARLAQTRVAAPADGRIVSRRVEPGQIVQPGRALFEFAASGPTQLVGQADEKFLGLLSVGQAARVTVDAFPQQPFDARLLRIAPGVDASRGTVEVKFDVPESPAFLREDMTLSLQVVVGSRDSALTLPASAVLGAGRDARVRRIVEGSVREQPVTIGLRTFEWVEIVGGLADGDTVLADPLVAEPGVRVRSARDGENTASRPIASPASQGAGAAAAVGGGR